MSKIELLAPAGCLEALKAALQNGADAVYLGGTAFSARAYASNFDREALKEAVAYAHIRGARVYVTVNTLVKDFEMQQLIEYIGFLYNIDVDAIIIQDLGVLQVVRKAFPELELHCSTQMTLHNIYGVQLVKELGIKRVVLARELNLAEIREIKEKTAMELEVFVHGALCVSYSGQCLMSSFIGGRSGNRGRCAQPCRRPYQLVSNKDNRDIKELYHISMRDLNTFDEIGSIIDSGVTSFKIEGRMKKPQYVASIVGAYRKAIDYYLTEGKPLRSIELQREMAQMFNRKFTRGYILDSPKAELVNIDKPNNRGILLGKVLEHLPKKGRIKLRLASGLSVGDGIEVWGPRATDNGGTVNGIFLDEEPIKQAEKGQLVELELKNPADKGDEVYKTLDVNLMRKLEKTYDCNAENKRILINADIKLEVGKAVQLLVWDNEGNTVYVESQQVAEGAVKLALSREKLLENLSKLGNTPYLFDEIRVELDEGLSAPLSLINKLRREAIEALSKLRENRNHREPLIKMPELPALNIKMSSATAKALFISIKADTISQLETILDTQIDRIYYGDINTINDAIRLCKTAKVPIYFRSSAIMRNEDYRRIGKELKDLDLQGILAGDLGMLRYCEKNLSLPCLADMSLNVMNSYSLDFVNKLKASGAVLSPELDLKSMERISLTAAVREAIIYGRLPVMTMEYCPLLDKGLCTASCSECTYPPYRYHMGIKDAKDMIFLFAKDCWGRTVYLNSQPLFMLDRLRELKKASVTSYRLEFTSETAEEIREVLQLLNKQIEALESNREIKDGFPGFIRAGGFTRGHYYRGVE